MIHHEVEQGSAVWFTLRAGIPTASEFNRILTPKKLELSKSAEPYMHRLLAEWMTGQVFETETTLWMSQGVTMEEKAVQYYELTQGVEVQECGFCTTDDGMIGASPDRFVGENGLLEVKCPMAPTHVGYLLNAELPEEYVLQVQGQLFVTQRQWCDFLSYYSGLPPLLLRVLPDYRYQEALERTLGEFVSKLQHYRAVLEEMRAK